jgi:hypothetical protein
MKVAVNIILFITLFQVNGQSIKDLFPPVNNSSMLRVNTNSNDGVIDSMFFDRESNIYLGNA